MKFNSELFFATTIWENKQYALKAFFDGGYSIHHKIADTTYLYLNNIQVKNVLSAILKEEIYDSAEKSVDKWEERPQLNVIDFQLKSEIKETSDRQLLGTCIVEVEGCIRTEVAAWNLNGKMKLEPVYSENTGLELPEVSQRELEHLVSQSWFEHSVEQYKYKGLRDMKLSFDVISDTETHCTATIKSVKIKQIIIKKEDGMKGILAKLPKDVDLVLPDAREEFKKQILKAYKAFERGRERTR